MKTNYMNYTDSLIEEYDKNRIPDQVKKAIELLKPYKAEMIPYWGVHGKKLAQIPDNLVAIHEKYGAILIPDIDNHIYIGNSHLDLYLSCWDPILANHFDVFAKIFDLAETSKVYKEIKYYIDINDLENAKKAFNDYFYDTLTLDWTSYDYYNEIYCWALLYLFNVVYLRCECEFLYWMDSYGIVNGYQIAQTERFLDLTFYTYPFNTWKGLAINNKYFSSRDGYIVDDVMKEFYK